MITTTKNIAPLIHENFWNYCGITLKNGIRINTGLLWYLYENNRTAFEEVMYAD